MKLQSDLLQFAKSSVKDAVKQFKIRDREYLTQITGIELDGKETKLVADSILEEALFNHLQKTGISIFSEESGMSNQENNKDLIWVIDPLDGSVNYLRGVGPCAVSVALCSYGKPLFGVLYSLKTSTISWGGREFDSWSGNTKLHVSDTQHIHDALICTGLPARFKTQNQEKLYNYFEVMTQFAKVRMLGSAASSLLMVAQGRADAYFEEDIMFWDVAAGMAIVEGAGGIVNSNNPGINLPHRITASNANLNLNKLLNG